MRTSIKTRPLRAGTTVWGSMAATSRVQTATPPTTAQSGPEAADRLVALAAGIKASSPEARQGMLFFPVRRAHVRRDLTLPGALVWYDARGVRHTETFRACNVSEGGAVYRVLRDSAHSPVSIGAHRDRKRRAPSRRCARPATGRADLGRHLPHLFSLA